MLIAVWYSQSFLFLAVINILVMALLERKEERERISFFHSGVVLHLCMIWYVGYKRAYWDRVCQTSGMFFTSQENEGCEVCTTQSGCSSNKSSSSKMTDCSGSTIKLHHSWYFPLSTDFFLDFLHDTHTHTGTLNIHSADFSQHLYNVPDLCASPRNITPRENWFRCKDTHSRRWVMGVNSQTWRQNFAFGSVTHCKTEQGWDEKQRGAKGLHWFLQTFLFSFLLPFDFFFRSLLFFSFFLLHTSISSTAFFRLFPFFLSKSLPYKFCSSLWLMWATRAAAKWLFVYNLTQRSLCLACVQKM